MASSSSEPPSELRRRLRVHHEPEPGRRWRERLEEFLPAYLRWYRREGMRARPGYLECERALTEHLPELVPLWRRLVDLAGGGDVAARLLSLWRPPPFLAGCSQLACPPPDPVLIRNYDYAPWLWEAVLWHTRWCGRGVLASGDCLWGALDGLNDRGLAASLSFGGRRKVGEGFGLPLILRYVLETCGTVAEAAAVLQRVPSHMAYNVSLVDAGGAHATVQVEPGGGARVLRDRASTNHQMRAEWTAYARRTASHERETALRALLQGAPVAREELTRRFLAPPLYADRFARGWGTLYTAVYEPAGGRASFHWRDRELALSLQEPREHELELAFAFASRS